MRTSLSQKVASIPTTTKTEKNAKRYPIGLAVRRALTRKSRARGRHVRAYSISYRRGFARYPPSGSRETAGATSRATRTSSPSRDRDAGLFRNAPPSHDQSLRRPRVPSPALPDAGDRFATLLRVPDGRCRRARLRARPPPTPASRVPRRFFARRRATRCSDASLPYRRGSRRRLVHRRENRARAVASPRRAARRARSPRRAARRVRSPRRAARRVRAANDPSGTTQDDRRRRRDVDARNLRAPRHRCDSHVVSYP